MTASAPTHRFRLTPDLCVFSLLVAEALLWLAPCTTRKAWRGILEGMVAGAFDCPLPLVPVK